MTPQEEQRKEAEELRAPEVVKPLSARKGEARRDSDDQKPHATKPQQVPPVENSDSTDKKPIAQAVTPKQSKTAVPPPRVATPPPLRADSRPKPPSPQRSQAAKPPSRNRGWIAIPVIAGVLLLLWYAGSTSSDAPSTASQPSTTPRPQTTQPIAPQRTPTVSGSMTPHARVSTEAPRPGSSAYSAERALPSTGTIRLSAYSATGDGRRRAVTGNAGIQMRHAVSRFAMSTNTILPCQWRSIPTGDIRLALAVSGYHPATTNVAVRPDHMTEVAIAIRPLPARVRFVFPTTNVVFDVWNDTRRLGASTTDWNLTPFVSHYLTFKADGWRPKRFKITPSEPGKSFRYKIDMERVAAGLRVTVKARKGAPPERGRLSINGNKFVEVGFPLERRSLPVTGPMTLALAVEGFTVLDPTQRVVLVDRELADVVFTVERRSWVSRIFGEAERPEGKE